MRKSIYLFLLISAMQACKDSYAPKPKGLLRIELPESEYEILNMEELPFSFKVAQGATIEMPPADSAKSWINIDYPHLNAKIYCSYRQITPRTLKVHEEECRNLARKALRNADEMTEQIYENEENKVFGTLFVVSGESASPVQFMLTDSSSRFFRGALYYRIKTEADSIKPVTEHIKKDMIELIQTFNWKKQCRY